MKLIVALAVVVILAIGVVLIPTQASTGARSTGWFGDIGTRDDEAPPPKSGLRIAVEGRLRWLGL